MLTWWCSHIARTHREVDLNTDENAAIMLTWKDNFKQVPFYRNPSNGNIEPRSQIASSIKDLRTSSSTSGKSDQLTDWFRITNGEGNVNPGPQDPVILQKFEAWIKSTWRKIIVAVVEPHKSATLKWHCQDRILQPACATPAPFSYTKLTQIDFLLSHALPFSMASARFFRSWHSSIVSHFKILSHRPTWHSAVRLGMQRLYHALDSTTDLCISTDASRAYMHWISLDCISQRGAWAI